MIFSITALALLVPSGTWYVDSLAPSPGFGTLARPYSRIDYALAQPTTLSGDVVFVSPGDYVDEAIDFLGKAVLIESTGDATDTWISGLGAGAANPHALVKAVNGEGGHSILRGFTLRHSSGRVGGLGGALYCSNSSPSIEMCRFEDNLGGQLGTAAYLDGGGPTFVNCWFGGNGGDGPLFGDQSAIKMSGCFFADNLAAPRGNLRMLQGNLLASDCFFDGNGAGFGTPQSAMHISAVGTRLTLNRCHLRSGVGASASGRGIYLESCVTLIDDSTFTDLHSQDVPGGALLAIDGDLSIGGSLFSGCATEIGVGGAIALVGCRTAITGSEFQNNSSASLEKSGGALYKWGPENLLVSQCLFEGNSAGEGGAIHVAHGPTTIMGCFFLDNVASTQGGNIPPARGGAIVALGPLFVEDTTFVGNRCTADVPGSTGHEALGGALFLDAPSLLRNCLLHENVASGLNIAFGGGIFCAAGGTGTQMERLQLRRNRSQASLGGTAQGGALAGLYEATHCSFIENEASGGGGSVFGGTLDHCILSGGIPNEVAGICQITYSLIEGGHPGQGNIDGDPLYWGVYDMHLIPGSPCIDAGDPLAPADHDGTPTDMGAVPFDFDHCGPGCYGEISSQPCHSLPNSTGYEALTRALGSPGVQDNLVILISENLPLGVPGYYLTAPQAGFIPLFGGSEGNLCLGAGILRMNDTIQFANAAGEVSRTVDVNQLPQGHVITAGSSWFFQLWYRDFNGVQSTSNTTSSAQIDFQ